MKTGHKIKKDKIAKIIRTDANVRNDYCDGHGHYCVLGGLLRFAGVPDAVLVKFECPPEDLPKVHRDTLRDVYGLEIREAERLLDVNDYHEKTHERRLALLEELDQIIEDRKEMEVAL